eukprot:CAMPEP_0168455786 /NCGR_PEP_ID=MMETSP0228-20121227/50936_1 /TAXON_ID=133427 /ORGANISM="Protoceratium reticulatum, Strain CCCM 535 (=CCMP 1889)" /LENGTH=72 /DNA_ID=CAMNT_0008470655 /DNA_START=11 /DNA_END=227 /DNA_ORIENTATION=-
MTKQLQVILTKLSDKSLTDEIREKYQALAQNVQTQMAKISKPQPQLQGGGGGCEQAGSRTIPASFIAAAFVA